MIRKEAPSYSVHIFIAGDWRAANRLCVAFCDEGGLCVTLTPTRYIYTGGSEDGVIVGLINYPRFPKTPEDIWQKAEVLAAKLRVALDQQSYTIQAPDKTVWFSHREADTIPTQAASAGEGR